MLRFLMVSRVFLAMYLVGHFSQAPGAFTLAIVFSVLLHHFRTFDAHGPEWTGGEKFVNTVFLAAAIGTMLFGVGFAWLGVFLQVSLAVLFAFMAVGFITYPFAQPKHKCCCCGEPAKCTDRDCLGECCGRSDRCRSYARDPYRRYSRLHYCERHKKLAVRCRFSSGRRDSGCCH